MLIVVATLASLIVVKAIDNGKGITPPMGWRSWNLFGANVDQDLIQSQMNGLVSHARKVNGVPTSLAELGYSDVGLDDNWQLCGSYTSQGYTYHDTDGSSVINLKLFPDFKKMTDFAHRLRLTAGWYHNNCICSDHCSTDECYAQDAKAIVDFGFDSVKLDGCGAQYDLQKWADLLNATGKSILIENCHWGNTLPTTDYCPYNYYRSSGDVQANYNSIISNLMSTVDLAKKNLSYPGCWAYPDMLEVGVPGLTFNEWRTHFGAWCIVSSPLILSHNTTNDEISDQIWPIISNTEAIAINQAWAGDSGTLFQESALSMNMHVDATVKMQNGAMTEVYPAHSLSVGAWQQWSKRLSDTSAAVLVINNGVQPTNVTLTFNKIPTFAGEHALAKYSVRDVWNHKLLGVFSSSLSVDELASHDSAFYVISLVAGSV